MNIQIRWWKPIRLRNGRKDDLIYAFDDVNDLPAKPGVYIFGRQYGISIIPLYIGRATNLENRIWSQLNNTRLMVRLEKAPSGRRILLLGELELRPGQQASRVLDVVEPTLIEYALAEGYELINVQGTRIHVHCITSRGCRAARSVAPMRMQRKRRG